MSISHLNTYHYPEKSRVLSALDTLSIPVRKGLLGGWEVDLNAGKYREVSRIRCVAFVFASIIVGYYAPALFAGLYGLALASLALKVVVSKITSEQSKIENAWKKATTSKA